MNQPHVPDPEFASRLQWQLESEFRRCRRFEPQQRRRSRSGVLKVAALVVLALFLGAAGVLAAQHYEGSWRSQLLLARTQTELELARARVELLEGEAGQLREEMGPETRFLVEEQLDQARLELREAELAVEEVRVTGSAFGDELTAPTAAGRDFLAEREQLRAARLQQRLSRLQAYWSRVGEEPGRREAEGHLVRQELEHLRTSLEAIRGRLELRREYLDGRLDARQVEVKQRLTELAAESSLAALDLESARRRVAAVRGALQREEASEFELNRAEFDLATVRARSRLLGLELDLLRRQLQR